MEHPVSIHHYPLGNIQKTIKHGPVEIVDLPISNCDFHRQLLVYQRVTVDMNQLKKIGIHEKTMLYPDEKSSKETIIPL